jgi:SAM-dependent methyltransferase
MSRMTVGNPGGAKSSVETSYVDTRLGFRARLREFTDLYRSMARGIPAQVAEVLREIEAAQERVRSAGGPEFKGLRVLDIGPGQRMGHFLALAATNQATGIDLDLNPRGLDVSAYWRLWRTNGSVRLLKTLGRKGLLLDRRFHRELLRQLRVERMPAFTVLRMDATRMTFARGSFDFVFSRSTFEHISDPQHALRNVEAVLASGGCAHVTVHLYTSDSGCHDMRILSGNRGDLPFWPHLRPESRARVKPNSYLNRILLRDWESLFEEVLPGARCFRARETNPELLAALPGLRAEGALEEYSDDELLTVALHVVWRAPT